MILSFSCKETEKVWNRVHSKKFGTVVQRMGKRKLEILHAATTLEESNSPPGNKLEALSGDLSGFHSIRINNQWRIIFIWTGSNCEEVKITDYH